MAVTCKDFKRGKWEQYEEEYIIDTTTGRYYHSLSDVDIADHARWEAVCGLFIHPFQTMFCMVGRTARLISCHHCRKGELKDESLLFDSLNKTFPTFTPQDRLVDTVTDVAKCVGGPVLCLASRVMSCVTAAHPNKDTMKWMSALDLLQFDGKMSSCDYFEPVGIGPAGQVMK